jgi:L-iditol 2-dehydrogenase
MKTRSIRYAAPEKIEFVDVNVGDPAPGEVQVQSLACGVCTWDLFTYKNGPGVSVPAPDGHEGVGRVIRIGADVKGIKEGSRVVARGFAGYYNMPADRLYPIPDDSKLPDENWIVEPVACVVTGVDHCNVRAGDRVAVVGCGFMGLMLIQALGRCPLDQLIAIDIDPRRLELARQFGATTTHNSADPGFEEKIPGLKALNIDTVVDSTGAAKGLDLSTKILKRGGRLNLFGWNHGQAAFNGDAWHLGGFTVVNSAPASGLRDTMPIAIRLLHRGIINLKPLVTHTGPLDQITTILDHGVKKTDGYIKGVVKLS